jgi:hypothetical protein
MAYSPRLQIRRLAIGTSISSIAILIFMLVSHLEVQWLFYLLVVITSLGILYAIPGYIGVWVWRMRDVLFSKEEEKQ